MSLSTLRGRRGATARVRDPMLIVIDGIGNPQTTNVGRTYPLHSGVVLGRNSIRYHTPVVGAAQETQPVYLTTYPIADFSFTGYIHANWLRVSSGEALVIRDSSDTTLNISPNRLLQRLYTNDCTVSYLEIDDALKLMHGDVLVLKQTDDMLVPPSDSDERQQITQGLRAFLFVLTTADQVEMIQEENVESFRHNLSAFLRCVQCSFATEEETRCQMELSTSENDERLRTVRAEILIQGLHPRLGASSWIGAILPDNVQRIVELL